MGSDLSCCENPSKSESITEFQTIDTDADNSASRDELARYIEVHAELWAMLSVTLNIDEEKSLEIVTNLIIQLATGSKATEGAELTLDQFHTFRMKYMVDPKGTQEFFHRAVFAVFDIDQDGLLDEQEAGQFLETFYKAGSIFKGDGRLPDREHLRKTVFARFDQHKDGKLSFGEISGLISGKAAG